MAGTIVVDRIESDASYASNINVASQITFSNTVNFGITSVAPVAGFYSPSTNNVAFTTASTERMRIDASGNVLIGTSTSQTGAKLAVTGGIQGTITSGTSVASTSGTSIDFTSIPSWVKRITVMFSGVSTNGTSAILFQLGSADSVETSSYISYTAYAGPSIGSSSSTSGFIVFSNASPNLFYGHSIFTLNGSNLWVGSNIFALNASGSGYSVQGGGNKTLANTLDRIRITTVNGTDTFDAGNINILYEG